VKNLNNKFTANRNIITNFNHIKACERIEELLSLFSGCRNYHEYKTLLVLEIDVLLIEFQCSEHQKLVWLMYHVVVLYDEK